MKRELVAVNVGDKVSDLPTSRRKKTVDYSVEHFKKLKEVFSGTELELVVIIGLPGSRTCGTAAVSSRTPTW